ncbi:DEAD/DEAH box helicase [Collinsella ihumii]|uniref:DEAD/DEAH box helicase family protein n=1 Tax=Collinsella ihumii TaxID=1720204 RepID=A0AAW7JNP3_9ACTN|nr:DEAD/DEAH box helicase family protein [Collinsella ihumii]MDN0069149.1 DEAD/DEAH box helicase family protein [Collinsella ihumii]
MELKQYQKEVLKEVGRFARTYELARDAATAYGVFMNAVGLEPGKGGVARYSDDLGGAPKVCVKVPTGGGKTFIGACAIDVLSDALPSHDEVVVWLVPRKEILSQTLKNFRNPEHFLRIRLDQDFAGRVEVLDKEDGLRGRGFTAATVGDQLTLFVLSYDSFKNKDGRRAYAENSSLAGLTEWQRDAGTAVDVEGADDTALISALAGTNPIVIVDESHHAKSKLSLDMLRNLNPRFVLELTATPGKGANVIAQATARQLKAEEMVKLPVVVYRRPDKRTTVADAVMLQRRLEVIAEQDEKRTGRYIRPIVLFQAERRGADDAETYAKLKQKLVEGGIPAEQIAVRTGDVDEIGGADLMARDCPIRFIVTVEALAEGWDCPFAYVLATVANKSSQVSVEQIVGRVLRQPYAARAGARSLNIAYVLTASADFDATLTQVVNGLNGVGFSREDVAVGGDAPAPASQQGQIDFGPQPADGAGDAASEGDDLDLTGLDFGASPDVAGGAAGGAAGSAVDGIIDASGEMEERFEEEIGSGADAPLGGLGGGSNAYGMRAAVADSAASLAIPQFMIRVDGGLFTDDEIWKPLDREDLLADFKLSKYGIDQVDINPTTFSEVREVDLAADSDEYRIRWLEDNVRKNMAMLFASMSDDGKRESLKALVLQAMSSQFKTAYGRAQLAGYISRVVDDMESPAVDACLHSVGGVASAVKGAVTRLADDFCEDRFGKLLSRGDVRLSPEYRLPGSFLQASPMTSYDRALYEAEDGRIDGPERKMVDLLANSPRVVWWHRVVERRPGEFSINGFINHYPDFLALRDDGVLMAIETKGEHLGDDARRKLRLGTRWADMAGAAFKYFMVFEHEALDKANAFTLAEFGSEILG